MKKILLLSMCCAFIYTLNAQLVVTEESNDTTFIYSLAGPGVTISNLTRVCGESGSGFYNASSAYVGIDEGILLTSGTIANALGPNASGSTSEYLGTDGDADLDALIPGYYTYDACVIEFDMTVAADTVRISYVFGSEEYLEYVGSAFNDVFAFWVSGPGIPDPVNIATIPGTDIPVAINNVNSTSYSDYYVNNGNGSEDPYMSDSMYVQYDGLTTVLDGSIPVTAGETYHMKIAVADAGDMILDSGVFLKTGSLGSLRMGTAYYGDGESNSAAEGCSNGYIEFTNYVPSDIDLVINYYVGGSATEGVDYEEISSQIIIPAGMSTATLPIIPIEDALTESAETVILYLYNPQSLYVYDSVIVTIQDKLKSDFNFEATATEVTFSDNSDAAVEYNWDFGDGTSSTGPNPIHAYAAVGTYDVCLTITNDQGCTSTTCKSVVIESAQGINALQTITFQLYPNPATDLITINTEMLEGTIALRDIQGRLIVTTSITGNTTTVNCSQLTPGIYTITVTDGNNTGTQLLEVK